MGQMFYSLSIAMGILITFGSVHEKRYFDRRFHQNVEIFDTAIAVMAGLMIIPPSSPSPAVTRIPCRPVLR